METTLSPITASFVLPKIAYSTERIVADFYWRNLDAGPDLCLDWPTT